MEKYKKAKENIVKNCLRIKDDDRVVIITDKETQAIGQAIYERGIRVVPCKVVIIEDYTVRPAKKLPDKLANDITDFKPTVSVYASSGKEGELQDFRFPLVDLLRKKLNCRHAHMIGVTTQIMETGMSQDYTKIYKAAHKLYDLLKSAKNIELTDEFGTNLQITFSPQLSWKCEDGIVDKQGTWINLPAGEVFTCPQKAYGKVVAWEVGDYFSAKYGLLDKPITLTIKDSRVTNVEGPNEQLTKELWQYLNKFENGARMGEFAVGGLLGLEKLIGNLLQDEKFPGIHMAFGHPYPEFTGQKSWDAPTHVDVIPLKVTANVDGLPLLNKGKFVVELN